MAIPLPESLAFALLACVGAVAGWVNTLAGGGSMLTVPALMLYGLPADGANATSRVAILAQGVAAAWGFRRHGKLDMQLLAGIAAPSVLGASIGAYAAARLPNALFKPLLLCTLLLAAGTLFIRPGALAPPKDAVPIDPRSQPRIVLALFGAGVYGGLLQAGVGIVLLCVFAGLCRIDLVRGNALKVAVILLYSLAAVPVFAGHGKVSWAAGAALAVGHVLGAQLGVHFAVREGQDAIRKVLFVAIVLTCVALGLR